MTISPSSLASSSISAKVTSPLAEVIAEAASAVPPPPEQAANARAVAADIAATPPSVFVADPVRDAPRRAPGNLIVTPLFVVAADERRLLQWGRVRHRRFTRPRTSPLQWQRMYIRVQVFVYSPIQVVGIRSRPVSIFEPHFRGLETHWPCVQAAPVVAFE